MNRLEKCIRFQLNAMIKSSIIFLAVYFAVTAALFTLFDIYISTGSGGSLNSGFYISAGIFVFVYVIVTYKEMFNYLLMFGNTRKNIILSTIAASAVMSLMFSIISTAILQAERAISHAKGYGWYGGISLLDLAYKDSSVLSESLWLFTFFFLICSFSLLYSTLAYKLGSVFITLFWVCFGLSFLSSPLLMSSKTISEIIIFFFCTEFEHGILLAPVNFTVMSVIFCLIGYVVSRRQPQTRTT